LRQSELRELVISAFDLGHGCAYSHVLPHRTSNYVDGLFHVGMLAGASAMAGDEELALICRTYLFNLCVVAERARNFCFGPRDGWKPSGTMAGYWYKEGAQAFAGPCAMAWARRVGPNLSWWTVAPVVPVQALALRLASRLCPWAFGRAPFKQHLNSVMLSHLLAGTTPPKALAWVSERNPVYAYIFKKTCAAWYPNTGPWPAKDVPFSQTPDPDRHYTPLCQLVGVYLQEALD
jgi:hypothetical protein